MSITLSMFNIGCITEVVAKDYLLSIAACYQ
jgi:hypothetical protein